MKMIVRNRKLKVIFNPWALTEPGGQDPDWVLGSGIWNDTAYWDDSAIWRD